MFVDYIKLIKKKIILTIKAFSRTFSVNNGSEVLKNETETLSKLLNMIIITHIFFLMWTLRPEYKVKNFPTEFVLYIAIYSSIYSLKVA